MKTFSEHSDLQEQEYKRTASLMQRRKLARRMRLLSKQAGFQRKKKRTLMRRRILQNFPNQPENKQSNFLGTKLFLIIIL